MLFLFYVGALAAGDVSIKCGQDIVTAFVFPSIYWFTGAILLFYPVLFIWEKGCPVVVRTGIYLIFLVLHIISDGIYAERYLIGFAAMTVGSGIRKYCEEKSYSDMGNHSSFICGEGLVTGFIYVILKLLRRQGVQAFGLVHLGIGIATINIAAVLLVWGWLKEDSIKRFSDCHQRIYSVVHVLAEVTLAVYLVQGFHTRIILRCTQKYLSFPTSYIFSIAVVFFFAVIVSKADEYFQKRIDFLWKAWRYGH